jgi:hypothetical protein
VPPVFDAQKIDLVSLSADDAVANLYIVQADAWTGADDQIVSLQQKIHNYVGFALDGQMVKMYPETASLGWRIIIDSQTGSVDARTAGVLAQVTEAVRRHGGDLVIHVG